MENKSVELGQYPKPCELNMRDLIETYSHIQRVNQRLWAIAEGDYATFRDKIEERFMLGLYARNDVIHNDYQDELVRRTGIELDPFWYEYGLGVGFDTYRGFLWLSRRLRSTEQRAAILRNAGYVPKIDIYGYESGWKHASGLNAE